MKNQFKYRLNKLVFILTLFVQEKRVQRFYAKNKNEKLKYIITENRRFLDSIEVFLAEDDYIKNDYGIQKRIYDQIDKPISDYPTYSDFIVYLINNILKEKINYLEIGVSVLKNFMQINSGISDANMVAYDINEINPNFNNLSSHAKNNNNLSYFKGSVLSQSDANKFGKAHPQKFNFIFSDALHTPEAIRSEYELIIKNSLDEEFILYYDDLDFEGLENEFNNIKSNISKLSNQKINFYTFSVFGWIGENEKLHKNGIITNIEIEELLSKDKLYIYKFKKIN